jgi:hypothetical protein
MAVFRQLVVNVLLKPVMIGPGISIGAVSRITTAMTRKSHIHEVTMNIPRGASVVFMSVIVIARVMILKIVVGPKAVTFLIARTAPL